MRFFSKTFKAKKDKVLSNKNIIILQDKNTASASENFIAGLKDNLENVLLIGNKTFGKGIGQFTMPLKRGFAVKATTMLWYTPDGINIQGEGISPDIYYNQEDIVDFALKRINQHD
jgi:C-terminal processing protease CtpA/Prc